MQADDIVLLRSGHRVVSVGIVSQESYAHNETFDDVYGWDLQHTRRVMWQPQLRAELDAIQQEDGELFGSRKSIPTFTRVKEKKVLDRVRHLFPKCSQRPLSKLPEQLPEPMSLDEFGNALFGKGLSYDAVNRVKITLQKQRQLLDWYGLRESDSAGKLRTVAPKRPTEHEIVAHVILPLMLAIGWSEQLLAVEWQRIDLAVFWGTPTDANHCKLICEAKKMGHGLQNVRKQAVRYTDTLKLIECDKILLADGGRFYLYRKLAGEWEKQPSGYFNVRKLRTRHLCPPNTNSVDTLVALTQSHVSRTET